MAQVIDHSGRDRSDDPERDRYLSERHRIENHAGDDLDEADAEAILEFLDALDPQVGRVSPGDVGTKEPSTLFSYGQGLRLVANQADVPLTSMSADELNVLLDAERERLSDNTIQVRQSALRVFLKWYDNGVDPEEVVIVSAEESKVDDRYIFDRAEIDAMHEAIDRTRDRAVFDLMLYTGQRIRAVLSLRVKDIDLEEGTFYLNTDTSGLKGATGKRPLLAAQGSVADWMELHPANDDPNAYFITKLPDSNKGDVHSMLYRSTIQRRLKAIGKRAGIDNWEERVHPHNFRHTFVRWAKVYQDLDDDEIRWMLGQGEGSRVMETTYKHLKDEDYLASIVGEEDGKGDITPLECPICDTPLPEGARACPHCTNVLTPSGAAARDQIEDDIKRSYREADPADDETMDRLDALDKAVERRMSELLGDPEFLERALAQAEED